MNRYILFFFVFWNIQFSLNAQNLQFNYITVEDGLSQNDVSCIKQDSDGLIWIGTYDGLNRFDGYEVEKFFHNKKDSSTLSSNRIRCLFEDNKKRVWIGTDGYGLNYYSLIDGKIYRVETPGDFDIINDIKQNNKGQILVATNQGLLLVKEDKESVSVEILQTPLTGLNVKKIKFLANDDEIYVGNRYLWRKHINEYKLIIKTTDFVFNDLVETVNSEIWVGASNGLYRLIKDTLIFKQDLLKDNIVSMCEGKQNDLWISTFDKGFFHVSLGKLSTSRVKLSNNKSQQSLSNNSVDFIYKDRSNIMWIGSKQGVAYANLDQSQFNNLPIYDKGIVRTLFAKDDAVFFGIQADKFYSYSFAKDTCVPIKLGKEVKPFKVDTMNGQVHLATTKGLYRQVYPKSNQFERVPIFNSEQRDKLLIITSMCNDIFGNQYFGTYKGLIYKNKNSVAWVHDKFKNLEFLRDVRVFSLKFDKFSKCLWVGTVSDGLFKINISSSGEVLSLEKYSEKMIGAYQIPNNSIWCFFQDDTGSLYVGTDTGLLVKKNDENRFHSVSIEGVEDNKIMGIVKDDFSNLWLSNSQGIIKYSLKDGVTTKYNYFDGLLTNSFTEGVSRNQSGTLFFGNILGINYFNPENLKNNPFPSEIAFTNLRVHNNDIKIQQSVLGSVILDKNLNHTDLLKLNHRQNNFILEFTSTNYSNVKVNKYRYKLIGYDENWQVVDNSKRFASYSNLPSGNYLFSVEATNPDGKWSGKSKTMGINVLAAPWNTWWAYLIYFLLFLAILSVLIYFWLIKQKLRNQIILSNFKSEQEKEINEMKLVFFTDVAHEFKTPLSLVIGPLNDLIKGGLSKEDEKFCYNITSRNTKRMMKLVNQLLDFRKINSGVNILKVSESDICSFVKNIADSFAWEAKNSEINLNIISPENYVCHFDKDILEKVIYNLLSNAFKYTPNKGIIEIEIKPTFKQEIETVVILIKDSGKGIPQMDKKKIFQRHFHGKDRSSSGIGLHLAATLIEAHRGEINVFNSSLGGTEFMITIPVYSKAFSAEEYFLEEDVTSSSSQEFIFIDDLEASENPEDEKETILLVEDDHDLRKYLKNILLQKFIVFEASNGKQGLDIAISKIPDIIISDVMMPEMDGIEMCKLIKENILISHIPILMLTAKTGDEYKESGLAVGAWDYIAKPFSSGHLFQKINNILENRKKFAQFITNGSTKKVKNYYVSFDQQLVQKAISIVEDKISDSNFTVEDLAKELGLSRMQLHRKFKALISVSTSNFINSIRIKKAIHMFDEGCDRVHEAMDSVGVTSYAHFNNLFKKEKGVTPQKYIEQIHTLKQKIK